MIKLMNIDHGKYIIDNFKYYDKDCINPNVKKKKYKDSDNKKTISNDKLAYIQIIYNNNPTIYITTPKMFCPFGLNTNTNILNLQFTNLSSDKNMKSFYEFIENLEYSQMAYIGLTEDNCDLYSSQIQKDKKERYDPTLICKLPFIYNKYEVDIFRDDYPITIKGIQKYMNLICDIYIDKIWKYNEKYICKWKVKNIYVYK